MTAAVYPDWMDYVPWRWAVAASPTVTNIFCSNERLFAGRVRYAGMQWRLDHRCLRGL
jgi:hypothetical protein